MIMNNFKCTIRNITDKDILSLKESANNVNIARFLNDSFPSPYKVEDATRWVLFCSNLPEYSQQVIECQGKVIGCIGITINCDIYRMTGEIGFWLAEDFWNKGIMTFIIKEYLILIQEQYNLNRIYARVFPDNVGSIRALEKNGFKFKCILSKEIIKKGVIYDALLYDLNF